MRPLAGDPTEGGADRRFLADAAHQLRTPIAGIQACAEALLRGVEPPEQDRLLTALVRETSRATRILNDLLALARLDEGRPVSKAPIDLVAVCRDEADRVWVAAPRVEVVLRADRRLQHVSADEAVVREIVANVLDNARRYLRSRVELTLRARGTTAEVRIADDGPGLPPGAEERAFARFVALDDKGGSGLGLAIARELARVHAGDLAYEDGAFVLRLPDVVLDVPPAG